MATYNALRQAVASVVDKWLGQNKTFSAHEVTMELRRLSNEGLINIWTIPYRPDGTGQEIIHDEVKADLANLIETGDIECEKKYNGTYFEYSKKDVGDLDDLVDPSCLAQASVPALKPVNTSKPDYSVGDEKKDVVVGYVTRKLKGGEQPTLKQIQSRMKGIPILLQGIKETLEEHGFKLSDEDYLTYVRVVG